MGRIFVRDGQLMASADTGEDNSVQLTPLSATRFVVLGTPVVVEFVPAANGRPPELHVTGDGPKPVVSQKLEPFALSSQQLLSAPSDAALGWRRLAGAAMEIHVVPGDHLRMIEEPPCRVLAERLKAVLRDAGVNSRAEGWAIRCTSS